MADLDSGTIHKQHGEEVVKMQGWTEPAALTRANTMEIIQYV